ncbi:MAG: hypothetical protein VZT48_07645 [Bulleidia sp.]|nr:hypothetical protein [Bulleidia sp.]
MENETCVQKHAQKQPGLHAAQTEWMLFLMVRHPEKTENNQLSKSLQNPAGWNGPAVNMLLRLKKRSPSSMPSISQMTVCMHRRRHAVLQGPDRSFPADALWSLPGCGDALVPIQENLPGYHRNRQVRISSISKGQDDEKMQLSFSDLRNKIRFACLSCLVCLKQYSIIITNERQLSGRNQKSI